MTITRLSNVDVQFPFEPYSIQKAFMSQVIRCLRKVCILKSNLISKR